MACRWSNELTHAEYRDLQASAMAVDCTGMHALLAGRKAMAVVHLNSPKCKVQRVYRQSKWEVSTIQWNPHEEFSHKFSTACSERVDIWSWEKSDLNVTETLKAHTRVVSDLDWSPKDNNIIATCSVDTFTYIWDIREHRKPSVSLSAVSGVSQVKWNKVNKNLLATAHDGGDIKVWDLRKGDTALHYISGHLSKIHGLDWAHNSETEFVTCSQDTSVKFWDINSPRQSVKKLMTKAPVWRARYTPFGDGLITVVVPQINRSETSLFLWYNQCLDESVHTFVGHTDVVLEFQWRKVSSDSTDYQLVTWSKDQSLRMWKIDQHLQKSCGQEVVDPISDEIPESTTSSVVSHGSLSSSPSVNGQINGSHSSLADTPVNTVLPGILAQSRNSDIVGSAPHVTSLDEKHGSLYSSTPPARDGVMRRPEDTITLLQEFDLVNFDYPGIIVHEKNARKRIVRGTCQKHKYCVEFTMTMPENYPYSDVPLFELQNNEYAMEIGNDTLAKFKKILHEVALSRVKHRQGCVEPCLRHLMNCVESIDNTSSDKEDPYTFRGQLYGLYPDYTMQPDDSVPFPRTSGARFCGSGVLVCFTRPLKKPTKRSSVAADLYTPRAFSALFNYGSGPMFSLACSPTSKHLSSMLNSYYDEGQRPSSKRQRSTKSRGREIEPSDSRVVSSPKKHPSKAGPVIIYDISCLLPVHRQLAESYILDTDNVVEMCQKNAAAASTYGRKDLEKTWLLIAETHQFSERTSDDPDTGPPWAHNPFGRELVKSLIDYYSRIHDVQTLAMLCCTLGEKVRPSEQRVPSPTSTPDTFAPTCDFVLRPSVSETQQPGGLSVPKTRRSNSWTEADCQDFNSETEKDKHKFNSKLLNPNAKTVYNHYKNVYADLLYGWGLLTKRAEVLKYVNSPMENHQGVEFSAICRKCDSRLERPDCTKCQCYAFICIICHIPVKGSSSFCLLCAHGGHSHHILQWFEGHTECPTGCGCRCSFNTTTITANGNLHEDQTTQDYYDSSLRLATS